MSVSNRKLFRLLQQWVAESYPGRAARRLVVELDQGEPVTLPVPSRAELRRQGERGRQRAQVEGRAARRYGQTRAKVLAVLWARPGETLDVKKVARLAGLANSPTLRACLGQLRAEGIVERPERGKVRLVA